MALSRTISAKNKVFTVFTFGDSILDCGRYNEYGVHPGQLIVRNNDFLFPEFKGRDLMSQSASMTALLDHGRVMAAWLTISPGRREVSRQPVLLSLWLQ